MESSCQIYCFLWKILFCTGRRTIYLLFFIVCSHSWPWFTFYPHLTELRVSICKSLIGNQYSDPTHFRPKSKSIRTPDSPRTVSDVVIVELYPLVGWWKRNPNKNALNFVFYSQQQQALYRVTCHAHREKSSIESAHTDRVRKCCTKNPVFGFLRFMCGDRVSVCVCALRHLLVWLP